MRSMKLCEVMATQPPLIQATVESIGPVPFVRKQMGRGKAVKNSRQLRDKSKRETVRIKETAEKHEWSKCQTERKIEPKRMFYKK
jgi:hypothetical protein